LSCIEVSSGDIGTEKEFNINSGVLKGHKLRLVYGDYSKELSTIYKYHLKAAKNAANENQMKMQEAYAESFKTGSLEAFKVIHQDS